MALSTEESKVTRKKSTSEKSYDLNAPEPIFTARYLGMSLLRDPFAPEKGDAISSKHVEELLWALKDNQKSPKVELVISTNISRGLTIIGQGGKTEMSFQLHCIAFCCTDKYHPKLFSFIAERDGELECHTFSCKTEDKAKEICYALSGAFSAAHSEFTRRRKRHDERKQRMDQMSQGISCTTETNDTRSEF